MARIDHAQSDELLRVGAHRLPTRTTSPQSAATTAEDLAALAPEVLGQRPRLEVEAANAHPRRSMWPPGSTADSRSAQADPPGACRSSGTRKGARRAQGLLHRAAHLPCTTPPPRRHSLTRWPPPSTSSPRRHGATSRSSATGSAPTPPPAPSTCPTPRTHPPPRQSRRQRLPGRRRALLVDAELFRRLWANEARAAAPPASEDLRQARSTWSWGVPSTSSARAHGAGSSRATAPTCRCRPPSPMSPTSSPPTA